MCQLHFSALWEIFGFTWKPVLLYHYMENKKHPFMDNNFSLYSNLWNAKNPFVGNLCIIITFQHLKLFAVTTWKAVFLGIAEVDVVTTLYE